MKQMGMDPKQMEGGPGWQDEDIRYVCFRCGFLEDVLKCGLCGQKYVCNQI